MGTKICANSTILKRINDLVYKSDLAKLREIKWSKKKSRKARLIDPFVRDGSIVTNATTLAKQSHLKFCPGLNVGFHRRHLYAKVPGRVMVTTEVSDFDPEHSYMKFFNPEGMVMSMTYFHVIPEEQHKRFKLVETN